MYVCLYAFMRDAEKKKITPAIAISPKVKPKLATTLTKTVLITRTRM